MAVPGSNLLNEALSVIQPNDVGWQQFLSRTTNAIGNDVPSYAAEVTIQASVQSVERSLIQQIGLDWKKKYKLFYTSHPVQGPQRDSSGDLLTFNGNTYQTLSENYWFEMDGWSGILAAELDT